MSQIRFLRDSFNIRYQKYPSELAGCPVSGGGLEYGSSLLLPGAFSKWEE